MRYGKLPSEVLALTPDELYLNVLIAFPDIKEAGDTQVKNRAREREMGFSPTRQLLMMFKGGKS